MKPHADAVLDLRGTILPIAMLQFTKVFGEMKPGSIMEVLVGDQETKINLFNVLKAYPYELLELTESETVYRVSLKKGTKMSRI